MKLNVTSKILTIKTAAECAKDNMPEYDFPDCKAKTLRNLVMAIELKIYWLYGKITGRPSSDLFEYTQITGLALAILIVFYANGGWIIFWSIFALIETLGFFGNRYVYREEIKNVINKSDYSPDAMYLIKKFAFDRHKWSHGITLLLLVIFNLALLPFGYSAVNMLLCLNFILTVFIYGYQSFYVEGSGKSVVAKVRDKIKNRARKPVLARVNI